MVLAASFNQKPQVNLFRFMSFAAQGRGLWVRENHSSQKTSDLRAKLSGLEMAKNTIGQENHFLKILYLECTLVYW